MKFLAILLFVFYFSCGSLSLGSGSFEWEDASNESDGIEEMVLYRMPEYISNEVLEEENSDELVHAFGLRRCTPTLCCPMTLLCGPHYYCSNTHGVVEPMQNCFQGR